MNVLVYTGPGTTVESVKHTTDTLRRLLSPYYAVIPVDSSLIVKEPWQSNTALLVIPGGADLGYCQEFNGEGCTKIRQYVQKGGRYLGLCAGGYFGAKRVEFEVGNLNMEVSGSRELGFYPGICRGAAYPGFKYAGHDGYRATEITPNTEFLGLTQSEAKFKCYYNGGGCFVDADKFKSKGVEVLASYSEHEPLAVDGGTTKTAAVYCSVGRGCAVLTGIHPEFFVQDGDTSDPQIAEIVAALKDTRASRLTYLQSMLTKMGLTVNTADTPIPSISRLKMTSQASGAVHELMEKLAHTVGFKGPGNNIIIGSNESFVFYDASQASYTDQHEQNSIPEDLVNPENESDPATQTKLIDVYFSGYPSHKETPYFNHSLYYEQLKRFQDENKVNGRNGSLVIYSEIISSTSTVLDRNYNLLAQLPHGLIVTATVQVSGRGRGNNVWVNPPGVLAVSGVLRFSLQESSKIVFVQYLVSLAMVEAIRDYGPGYDDMEVHLKWPNDIYVRSKASSDSLDSATKAYTKIGGVLVTSNIVDKEYVLVYGTGVNVSNAAPTTSLNSILELYNQHRQSQGLKRVPPYESETLLAAFQAKLEKMLAIFTLRGFVPFELQYYKYWLHSGQKVTLEQYQNVSAVIKGITMDHGLLIAEEVNSQGTATGQVFELQPDGNSFDMFRGLLKRKQ